MHIIRVICRVVTHRSTELLLSAPEGLHPMGCAIPLKGKPLLSALLRYHSSFYSKVGSQTEETKKQL